MSPEAYPKPFVSPHIIIEAVSKEMINDLREKAQKAMGRQGASFWEISSPDSGLADRGNVALNVACDGGAGVHWAYGQLTWTMEDDMAAEKAGEKVGFGTEQCRDTARFIGATSPAAVLALIRRIEELEGLLTRAGFVESDGQLLAPADNVVFDLNRRLDALRLENESLRDRLSVANDRMASAVRLLNAGPNE